MKKDYLFPFALLALLAMIAVLECTAIYAFAQDAAVVQLTELDSINAKAKWEQLQRAQKEWDDEKAFIQKTYIVHHRDGNGNKVAIMREGFEAGSFTFSKDFKYIVPVDPSAAPLPSRLPYNTPPCVSHGGWTDCNGFLYINPKIESVPDGGVQIPFERPTPL